MPNDNERSPDVYASSHPQSLHEAEWGEQADRRAERRERITQLEKTQAETPSDERLLASLLFQLVTSHVHAAEAGFRTRGLHDSFDADDAEPTRALYDAVAAVRERLYMQRRAILSPIGREQIAATMHDARDIAELFLALELAWGVIANVSGGDWTKQSSEWIIAAEHWRDQHFLVKPNDCLPSKANALTSRTHAQWKSLDPAPHNED